MRMFILLVTLWFSNFGFCNSDDALDFSIRQNFMSARALGMGNAYIALADDYNTVLLNPAGLARLQTWQLNLSLEAALGSDLTKFISDFNEATSSSNSEADLASFLTNFFGTRHHFRAVPASGFLVRPNWGLAVIPFDFTANLAIRKSAGPRLNAVFYGDTTVAMGIGRDTKVGNGRLSWGVTGKLVHRLYSAKALSPLDIAANEGADVFNETDAAEGLTADADIGMLWTPRVHGSGFWRVLKLARPTFGAVVRNVLDIGFPVKAGLLSENSGEPVRLYRTLDLGTKWEYPKFWIFRSRGLLDIRDIGHPNWNPMKGLHVGWELLWRMYDWWKGAYRFGLNQGYATFGFSAKLGIWNLDLATWGEEVGTFNTRKENRRYMFKMNIEI